MVSHPSRAQALRDFRLFESSDLDETREQISRVMQPHLLQPTSRGIGHSHMDFVRIGGLGLGTIVFGDEMRVDINAVDGYYLMMFCLAGSARVTLGRQEMQVDRTNAVLCAPGTPFRAELSPDCEQLVLRIDAATLDAARQVPPAALPPHVQLDRAALHAWTQHVQMLLASPALLKGSQENARVAGHLEGLLLELLVSGHEQNCRDGKEMRISPAYIRRAVDYIAARSGDPLRIVDIAEAVGTSERALRNGFQQFKGMTPMQFLHEIRLEQARQRLTHGPATARVSDIALECGFAHLGRFAAAYRERFGETPLETLRRR